MKTTYMEPTLMALTVENLKLQMELKKVRSELKKHEADLLEQGDYYRCRCGVVRHVDQMTKIEELDETILTEREYCCSLQCVCDEISEISNIQAEEENEEAVYRSR